MRKIFALLLSSLLAIAWYTPRPNQSYKASMDVQAPSTDVHTVGTKDNIWKSVYSRYDWLAESAASEFPTEQTGFGVFFVKSADNLPYFKTATGAELAVIESASLSLPLSAINGGTNIALYASGDLIIASRDTALARLARDGTPNRFLKNSGTQPATTNTASWDIVLLSDTYGNLPMSRLSEGPLGIASGGTNATTYATNRVITYDGTRFNDGPAYLADEIYTSVRAKSIIATDDISTPTLNVTSINASGDSSLTGETNLSSTGNFQVKQNGTVEFVGSARPKSTIVLTGKGAELLGAVSSADTLGLGGANMQYKITPVVFSHNSVWQAQWSFDVPDSYVGTSVDAKIVWYQTALDNGTFSFDVTTVGLNEGESFNVSTDPTWGSVTDSGGSVADHDASSDVKITSSFSVPAVWASKDLVVVTLQENATNAAHTATQDAKVAFLVLEYEKGTLSD